MLKISCWIESKKQQLFKIETFCNIINVFTDTFDQCCVIKVNFLQTFERYEDIILGYIAQP